MRLHPPQLLECSRALRPGLRRAHEATAGRTDRRPNRPRTTSCAHIDEECRRPTNSSCPIQSSTKCSQVCDRLGISAMPDNAEVAFPEPTKSAGRAMNVEQLLTSTRSARKIAGPERPTWTSTRVRDCLADRIAGRQRTNLQSWRWLIVTDQDLRTRIAALYRKAYLDKVGGQLIAGSCPKALRRRGSCRRQSGWSSIWVKCRSW